MMIVAPGVVYVESLDIFRMGQYSLAVACGVLPEVRERERERERESVSH